jgi:hypothetical protein
MAGSSFFALFDDIAALLDDIATMSKVAAQKTAGVLGDDLALNAQQVAGVNADRELPVVWAVAKGALLNKVILVPAALAISALIPWLIMPLLMIGGAYLCFEGAEKILHVLFHKEQAQAQQADVINAAKDSSIDMVQYEKDKIKGAIRTDFILSAEIIVIALGTIAGASLLMQSVVLSLVAIGLTLVVYGIVALIVKIDDAGFYLLKKTTRAAKILGQGLIWLAPKLMKFLSIFGTIAMFLVGGGILMHGLPFIASALHHLEEIIHHWPAAALFGLLVPALINLVGGFIAGLIVVGIYEAGHKLKTKLA